MKNIIILRGGNDLYNRALAESLAYELKENYSQLNCRYYFKIKDVFGSDVIVICGGDVFSKTKLLIASIFRKKFYLCHILDDKKKFKQLAKKSKLVILSKEKEDGSFNSYYSPVLLSDLSSSKRIARIWRKEKLVSKRGSIGIIGCKLDDSQQTKLASVLDLLVQDLDLNVVFIPISDKDETIEKEIRSQIKFNANIHNIETDKYSVPELIGLLSKIDILITLDYRGVVCAMASNRPVISLRTDLPTQRLLENLVQEDVLLNMDELSCDEIYTKIKIAWVHREAIVEQMQARINKLKQNAMIGIRQLGKNILKGGN